MMGAEWGIFMTIFMLLFWGLIIAGIVLLVRFLVLASGSKSSADALEILKRRYARGELGKVEFEEKKKDLMS
ncbi:MAG: SHOCT domain-containing protein [Deltaproteobacteria bacterium]|nr:SHOCT domain-containing protein [Deltaproteobacteria bacterium]